MENTSSNESGRQIQIRDLSPDLGKQNYSFHAVVTLVWPYSSSNHQLCLLLAESDFLLRRQNGQVKAIFHGSCAENVARAKVGIGDQVVLSVNYARWAENGETTSSLGRGIRWDLHYEGGIDMKIIRQSDIVVSVRIDRSSSPPPSDGKNFAPERLPGWSPSYTGPIVGNIETPPKNNWQSPLFLQSTRSSLGNASNASLDLFAEDDGFVPGRGRKRPRFSMRSNEWRLLDDAPSPVISHDSAEDEEESLKMDIDDEGSSDQRACEVSGKPEKHVNTRVANNQGQKMLKADGPNFPELLPSNTTDEIQGLSDQVSLQSSTTHTSIEIIQSLDGPATSVPFPTNTSHPSTLVPTEHPISPPIITSNPRIEDFPVNSLVQIPESHPSAAVINPSAILPGGKSSNFFPTNQFQPGFVALNRTLRNDESLGAGHYNTLTQKQKFQSCSSEDDKNWTEDANSYVDSDVDSVSLVDQDEDRQAEYNSEAKEDEADDMEQIHSTDTLRVFSGTTVNQRTVSTEHIDVISLVSDDASEHGHLRNEIEEDEEDDEEEADYSEEPPEEAHHFSEEEDEQQEEEAEEHDNNNELSASQPSHTGQRMTPQYRTPDDQEGENMVDGYSENTFNTGGGREYYHGDVEEDEVDTSQMSDYDESEEDYHQKFNGQLHQPLRSGAILQPEVIVLDSDSDDEPPITTSGLLRSSTNEMLQSPHREDPLSVPGERMAFSHHLKGHVGNKELSTSEGREVREDEMEEDDKQDDSMVDDDQPSASETRYSDRSSELDERITVEGEMKDYHSHFGKNHHETDFDNAERDSVISSQYTNPPIDPVLFENPPSVRPRSVGLVVRDIDTFSGEGFGANRSGLSGESGNHEQSIFPKESIMEGGTKTTNASSTPPLHRMISPETTQPDDDGKTWHLKNTEAINPLPTPRATQIEMSLSESEEIMELPVRRQTRKKDTSKQGGEEQLHDEFISSSYSPNSQGNKRRFSILIPKPHLEPSRYATGLRSRLSYFAPLSTLFDNFNSVVDTISVVVETSAPVRTKTGPRDYFMSLRLTDPSLSGTTLFAQIFRPHKVALPIVADGDVVLLRNFRVKTFNHAPLLLSTNISSWAVFYEEKAEPRITGAPLEYGPEETGYANGLRDWYNEDGAPMVADYMLQSSADRERLEDVSVQEGIFDERDENDDLPPSRYRAHQVRRKPRRITIHELRDGRKYQDVISPSDSIHELRDGTVYSHTFSD